MTQGPPNDFYQQHPNLQHMRCYVDGYDVTDQGVTHYVNQSFPIFIQIGIALFFIGLILGIFTDKIFDFFLKKKKPNYYIYK